MAKKVYLHLPMELANQHRYAKEFTTYYDKISKALTALGIENEYNRIPQHKELRRNTDFNHIVHRSRNNRDTIMHTDVSHLLDYFYLDTSGTQGWSDIRRVHFDPHSIDQDIADQFFTDIREKYVVNYNTKNDFDADKDVDNLPQDCIAIFLQYPSDDDKKTAYIDNEAMIDAAIRNRNGRPIIIKKHPICMDDHNRLIINNAVKNNPNIIQVHANTHAMMPKIDTVVTINSGAGFEALLHEKHVVTLGKCDYQHVTANHRNPDKAFEIARQSGENIRKYIYWYLNTQVVHLDAPNFNERIKEQLTKAKWI